MIIEKIQKNQVVGVDGSCTLNMGMDLSNSKKLALILSQNLYLNPIGSIIREYVSNALDSMRESGNTDPIVVSLLLEENNWVFSVQDFGMGLSPERVENVFAKYLSSTKEDSVNELGFYGIGSKSALSYRDSFNIISRHEGVEYRYVMFKGEEGTQLSLLDMEDTLEKNGVTIKIALKSSEDKVAFVNQMKQQLAYFSGVLFNASYNEVSNDFKIVEGEDWKFSGLNSDKQMHLCLGDVYYPINFKELGIDPIQLPIGLKFGLSDGIIPTPSRESFVYNASTKEKIIKKAFKVKNAFIDKWNNEQRILDDVLYAFRQEKQLRLSKDISISLQNINRYYVSQALFDDLQPCRFSLFPNVQIEHMRLETLYEEYVPHCKYLNYSEARYETKNLSHRLISYFLEGKATFVLHNPDSRFDWKKKKFCEMSKALGNSIVFVKRQHTRNEYVAQGDKIGSYANYVSFENGVAKDIDECKAFFKYFADKMIPFDEFFGRKKFLDYLATIPKTEKSVKKTEEASLRYYKVRSYGKEEFSTPIKALLKSSSFCLYGKYTQFSEIQSLHSHLNVDCCIMVASEYEKFKQYASSNRVHNWFDINDLYNVKCKLLSKVFTRRFVEQEVTHIRTVIRNSDFFFCKKLEAFLEVFNRGLSNNHLILDNFRSFSKIDKLMAHYLRKGWLDVELVSAYDNCFKDYKKYLFLSHFCNLGTKEYDKLARRLLIQQIKEEKATGKRNWEERTLSQVLKERFNY